MHDIIKSNGIYEARKIDEKNMEIRKTEVEKQLVIGKEKL